jgi:hypothetical protein
VAFDSVLAERIVQSVSTRVPPEMKLRQKRSKGLVVTARWEGFNMSRLGASPFGHVSPLNSREGQLLPGVLSTWSIS